MVQEYVYWMTYWIVLAAATLAEEVADLLLGCWLPLYYEAKLVLLLWLYVQMVAKARLMRRLRATPATLSSHGTYQKRRAGGEGRRERPSA